MSFEIWENARLATMQKGQDANYGLIEDGALVVEGERLAWVGLRSEMPAHYRHGALMHDAHHVFINGESFKASGRDAQLLRRLSNDRHLDARAVGQLSSPALTLLSDWCDDGWMHPQETI